MELIVNWQSKLPFSVLFLYSPKVHFYTHLLTFSPYTRQIGGNVSFKHTVSTSSMLRREASQLSVNCWLYRAKEVSTSNGKKSGKVAHRESAKMMNICERVTGR